MPCEHIAAVKSFRVYCQVTVEAAYDIPATSAEEAAHLVHELDLHPDHLNEDTTQITKVLGAIPEEEVAAATSYQENCEQIEARKKEAEARRRENEAYAREEAELRETGDAFSDED